MRPRTRPRPDRDAVLALPVHVLVRDYPEVLRVLHDRGVDPRTHGAHTLAQLEAAREDGAALLAALLDATDWRPTA